MFLEDTILGGKKNQKAQAGPVRLHLLGERGHLYSDPVCFQSSPAWKAPPGAEADQAPVLRWIKQKLMSRFLTTDMGDVSLVLGMGVTRRDGNGDHHSGETLSNPAGAVRCGKL